MMADTKESSTEDDTFTDEWMIRPCKSYLEEYKDCRSIKARFHQYFIHGESIDCSQWRRDFDSCKKWEDDKELKAAKELVKSETERRLTRLRAHYNNNVWEKRTEPPEDWNKPLPDYLQKEYENTFLNIKSKEMKGEHVENLAEDLSNKCVIM